MKRPLPGIAFLGLGYIGLCTATSFALKGFKVAGVDVEQKSSLDRLWQGSVSRTGPRPTIEESSKLKTTDSFDRYE